MRDRFLLLMTLALAGAALPACGDDVTDPDGLLESAEAEAVTRSADALPSLAGLMDAVEPRDDRSRATLLRARELWDAGTAVDDPRAGARRRLAVGYALPVLLEQTPEHHWVETRERVDDWMGTAGAMLRHLSMPEVQQRLETADDYLRRSDASLVERTRVYYLLMATSELVETTPRYVARSMSDAAAEVVERAAARTEEPLSGRTLERAERLKDWAAVAVEEAEYLLAIQRAYYAMQLVEGP